MRRSERLPAPNWKILVENCSLDEVSDGRLFLNGEFETPGKVCKVFRHMYNQTYDEKEERKWLTKRLELD